MARPGRFTVSRWMIVIGLIAVGLALWRVEPYLTLVVGFYGALFLPLLESPSKP